MTPSILNVPRTPEEWAVWTHAHAQCHRAIRETIASVYGVLLGDYVLDPLMPQDTEQWLDAVQQTHIEMTEVLGLQSADLEDVDLSDERQLAAWIYLVWQEDLAACKALGIPG